MRLAILTSLLTLPLLANPAAREVINNFSPTLPWALNLNLNVQPQKQYSVEVKDGSLHISGSSGVAICRGYYDFIKSQGWGIESWSGRRFAAGELPDTYKKSVKSPFAHHYYLNVVTYGYTTPYWDWNRWSREIDWMALHGFDMPLALCAQEAIMQRVWLKMGLTQAEIDAYNSGPAHLPWQRMGNLSSIDGPLSQDWHKGQVELQHKILKKMKALGMKPICPAFAGFVPPALKRLYPDIKLTRTSWAGSFHNWMLAPDEELFARVGSLFIKEWEAEFGKNNHYLVDSFNEMEIPFPPHGSPERSKQLEAYGRAVYASIKGGNPDATWVMQGWMFGYQRAIWTPETLEALLKGVPDDKMLLLDLAVDYNKHFWHSSYNWDFYKGYFNKPWVYSTVPNMGGKTAQTGVLEFYANGQWEALNSVNKGRLVGYGTAPEGIENNEVIYELIADAGWSEQPIILKDWLVNYDRCRYGQHNEELAEHWQSMLSSVYGSFTDHPRFSWQFRPGMTSRGTVNFSPAYQSAIKQFAALAPKLGNQELYRADLIAMAAFYAGGKLEELAAQIKGGDIEKMAQFEQLMLAMDALMQRHPNYRLEGWLEMAQAHGDNYAPNARRIVSIWGPPIDDYSARIWSGLIRDYYLPRWKRHFAQMQGEPQDIAQFEKDWVAGKIEPMIPIAPPKDVLSAARNLIASADTACAAQIEGDPLLLGSIPAKQQGQVALRIQPSELSRTEAIVIIGLAPALKAQLRLDGQLYPLQRVGNELRWALPEGYSANNDCMLLIDAGSPDKPLRLRWKP